MKIRQKILLALSIIYFIVSVFAVNWVNQRIIDYISENGWLKFNAWFVPFLTFFGGLILGMAAIRLKVQKPSKKEVMVALIGTVFSAFILSRTLLLTTELVHLPQFAIFTFLLLAAFSDKLHWGLGISAVACVLDEWIQSFSPGRVLDINDIFLNFIGLFLGLIVYWSFSARIQPMQNIME